MIRKVARVVRIYEEEAVGMELLYIVSWLVIYIPKESDEGRVLVKDKIAYSKNIQVK